MKCCYRERSKIIPVKPTEQPKTSRELTELFWGEALTCGICKQTFTLRQHEVVAYCGGCYKFLHCGIAGKCVGPNCPFKYEEKLTNKLGVKRAFQHNIL